MLQYNPTVTGSLQVSGDITGTVNGINITGLSQSLSTQLISVQVSTGSSDARLSFIETFTSSALTRLTNIESKSASVDISISNINSITASNIARLSNLETKSSSVDISISNINSFTSSNAIASLNSKTGSYATTGSNSFYGTQVFSGSVYIANDLIVQGSSSIQYISASSVSIGTNVVQLNTANPSVRFAGLSIIDSGSVGGSGSFLYDSREDEFIFVHRGNGTNVTSSHFVLGPETYDSLGNETYLTCNVITKGTGKEHLVDSCIFDNGTTTCIKNNLVGTGTACFTGGLTIGNGDTKLYSAGTSLWWGANGGTDYGQLNWNTGEAIIAATTGNQLTFRTNGVSSATNRMIITCGGNVGIGTDTPNFKTHISTGTTTSITQPTAGTYGLYVQQNTSGNIGGIYIQDGASNSGNSIYVGDNNGAARFVINTDGSVGIGICSPTHQLHVVNSVKFDTGLYFNNSAANGAFVWQIANESLRFGTCDTERMRITSGGYVGIGTCTPNNTLQVLNSQINGGVYNTNSSGDSIGMIPFQRGNGSDFFGLSRNGQMSIFAFPSCSNVFSIGTQNASDMIFGTNGVERVRVICNGNVSFSCSVNFNGNGSVTSKVGGVYNGTTTVTIGPASYNGVMQIMVGVFGNGSGNTGRAMWIGGGYVGSGMPFTEVTRYCAGAVTIGALNANAGCYTFTVGYSFPNSADISVTVIGTNANTAPATITIG